VQRAQHASTLVLNGAVLVLGLVMIVSAFARGGGVLALGVVLGALFVALGTARLWLALRGSQGERR
jgi:hypothetical protein